MDKLVDKIIECDYKDLQNLKIPMEKIGLIVYRDSVKYEFILNLKKILR